MDIVYALEDLPNTIVRSLFLAGPTARDDDGINWRKDALQILSDIGFDGTVFVPEPRDGSWHKEYDRQIDWEDFCLNTADCIAFWVPRDLKTMPGYTTNIEFGRYESSGKVVLGYPTNAPKMSYIDHYARKFKIEPEHSLTATLEQAVKFIGKGVPRTKGDRYIPYYIWKTPQFQSWHKAQTEVGNYIERAQVLYNRRLKDGFPFLLVIQADIYVAAEDRVKRNDCIVSRTDIASVMLWKPETPIEDSSLVLVSEFRPSVSNQEAMVYELPSGSSADRSETNYRLIAAEEAQEEVGLYVEHSRLKSHGVRQLASTFSSHKSHLFSVELTEEELEWCRSQEDVKHGNIDEGEQTYVRVVKLRDLWEKDLLDWTMLGQIMTVVRSI